MRVIAGKARRLNLKTIPGNETRPTTDRIKETLFNILQPEIPGCRFLDLFSGSGAIGIEALSRGAEYAVFVEKNPKACTCIRENLSFTKLTDGGKLLNMDVLQALRSLEGGEPFDCIFMDPPYNKQLEKEMLERMQHVSFIDEDTMIKNIEAAIKSYFSEMAIAKSYISQIRIGSEVLKIAGVEDCTNIKINGSAGNVEIPVGYVPVLKGVSII